MQEQQAATRNSFSSVRGRRDPTRNQRRPRSNRQASISSDSDSTSASEDLPNAKYAEEDAAAARRKQQQLNNALVMPGLPPGVSTGALNVSISGGKAKESFNGHADQATPRLKLTSGLYPSASHHSTHPITRVKSRSTSDNTSNRMNGGTTPAPSTVKNPSINTSYTASAQTLAPTTAISAAYNPYQYTSSTKNRQPFVYKPPTRVLSTPNHPRPTSPLRQASSESVISDPNIIDMSSSTTMSHNLSQSTYAPTSTAPTTLPSLVLSTYPDDDDPPGPIQFIDSSYVPSLDNPERHRVSARQRLGEPSIALPFVKSVGSSGGGGGSSASLGGFRQALKGVEVDMRFALFRGMLYLHHPFRISWY